MLSSHTILALIPAVTRITKSCFLSQISAANELCGDVIQQVQMIILCCCHKGHPNDIPEEKAQNQRLSILSWPLIDRKDVGRLKRSRGFICTADGVSKNSL